MLLCVVTAPAARGIEIIHALAESPAAAGLEAGDILLRIAGTELLEPSDIDRALHGVEPGTDIDVEYSRQGGTRSETIRVIHQRSYRGGFLPARVQGQTGFEAPEWLAYAWAHVAAGASPPTRANTDGMVVVIHAFQSW
ncbi:MAG: PDZ domain-containing protein [Candidatus Krumholzibacteriia bacterium]